MLAEKPASRSCEETRADVSASCICISRQRQQPSPRRGVDRQMGPEVGRGSSVEVGQPRTSRGSSAGASEAETDRRWSRGAERSTAGCGESSSAARLAGPRRCLLPCLVRVTLLVVMAACAWITPADAMLAGASAREGRRQGKGDLGTWERLGLPEAKIPGVPEPEVVAGKFRRASAAFHARADGRAAVQHGRQGAPNRNAVDRKPSGGFLASGRAQTSEEDATAA